MVSTMPHLCIMNIILCNNPDEKNVIDKNVIEGLNVSGFLKNPTSIINPVIEIQIDNPALFNYAYIPDFNRYYFITNIRSIRVNLWEISMHVDVLKSYAEQIKSCAAIISDTEETESTPYMNSDIFRALVKDKTDIINFPNGLLENGQYILITAGG